MSKETKKTTKKKASWHGGNRASSVGRPSKMTYATFKKLVDIFRIDGTVEEACSQAGISVQTFYNYYNTNSELFEENGKPISFVEEIDQARKYPFIVAKKTLLKSAHNDPRMALEFLKRRHKDYKDKSTVEVTEHFELDESLLSDE